MNVMHEYKKNTKGGEEEEEKNCNLNLEKQKRLMEEIFFNAFKPSHV